MSQPPQGQFPTGPDDRPSSGDQPEQGGGWGQSSGQPAPPSPSTPPTQQQPTQPQQQPGPGGWAPPGWQPPGQPGWRQPGQGGWGPPPGQPGQGGWGQPQGQPGPGGWGPPGQPGEGGWGQPPMAGGQRTQVFGAPGQPPHPGATGWGGPGGPGGPGAPGGSLNGNGKRNGVIALIAGLVVLAVVAAVLLFTLGGDDPQEDTQAASDGAATSAPSSSPGARSSSSSGGFTAAPPSGSGGGGNRDLVAMLPQDFTDCAGVPLAGDGDIAAASCGAAVTQPGPERADFFLYPDQSTLDAVFDTDLLGLDAPELPADGDCATSMGFGEWTYPDGSVGGRVVCAITQDGNAMIAWTDAEFLTEGVVQTPGSTQQDVATLYEWWSNNSDYQG
jgi:hypothetical protein